MASGSIADSLHFTTYKSPKTHLFEEGSTSPPVPTMDHTATSSEPKLQGDTDDEDEGCDMEVLDTLSKSFREAQALLDENRSLIGEVKENQQSLIPENLTKNVALISHINQNISKVISIYSHLSADFSKLLHHRPPVHNPNTQNNR
ncbi:hypothetical protein M5689_010838 [Euphorbia peplus]|nr:hypothetical protein M5689_010838 [Euphorbia peplus]